MRGFAGGTKEVGVACPDHLHEGGEASRDELCGEIHHSRRSASSVNAGRIKDIQFLHVSFRTASTN
jgi:hypothetical protein